MPDPTESRPTPYRPRNALRPNFMRFIVTGAVLGFVGGLLVAYFSTSAPQYGTSTVLGYFGVLGAGLGALIAGVVVVLVDRRY